MKILVTGATGFIGSHLAQSLGAVPIKSDVRTPAYLREEIRDGSEGQAFTLIHCAAMTDVDACERDKKTAWDVNVIGTSNVMNAVPVVTGKVILLSSCHVFSGRNYFPYSERHSPDPANFYGSTKFAAEAVTAISGVRSVVVRIGRAYDGNTEQKIIMSNDPVPSFLKRNFIHVDDVVSILSMVADTDFSNLPLFKKLYRVLHVGNPDNNFAYNHFYNIVRAKFGKPPVVVRSEYQERDAERPMRCAMNVKQMQKLFGHSFRSI